MSNMWIAAILNLAFISGALSAQTTHQESPVQPEERQTATARPQKDGLFTFATKMINPKDVNYGELIAERRNALADASVNNSYFWYGAGSTATVLVLLFILYATLLSYYDYRWRAAEVITDLRNSEKLATAKTRQAVAGYKRHMVQCNRVVEAEIAGRVLPGAVVNQDMQRTTETLREKLKGADTEISQLTEQLKSKEEVLKDLTSRLDALEETNPAPTRQTATGEKSHSELLALVNRLTRELDSEKRRNGILKGA